MPGIDFMTGAAWVDWLVLACIAIFIAAARLILRRLK